MAQEIKMSAAGLKAMQEELEYLKTVRRKELAEEIKEARSHGDLSENSEYDEAKNTQGLVENRITELEQTIKNAVIIDESELSVDNVSVGTHVTIRETGEDEAEEYDIVGRTEADAFNGKISDERFMELSADYEQEQLELKDRAAALLDELDKSQAATVNAEKFMGIVRKHLAFEELTPTLLREMIEKIVVHECSYDENGTRRQDIEIYYSFVGKIDLPEA